MFDTRFLRASDGTGPAPIARVNTARLPGATVYKVDTVNKWPSQAFIATIGTLNANGYIDPTLAPVNEFRGHLSGADIIIDSWEPGFPNATVDIGNAVNQYIILKQTTGWSNLIQDSLAELQAENVTRQVHNVFDYIQSGGVWAGLSYGATLTASMTAVTAYINGLRATLATVPTRTFTASKDTYVDLLLGGTSLAPTLTLVYTEQVNNGVSPALAANSIRLAIVVTGATNILNVGSINQGEEYKLLPIASGIPYQVTDSLGNLIAPRDPARKLLGQRLVSNLNQTNSGALALINSLAVPVIIPTLRKVKVTLYIPTTYNTTAGAIISPAVFENSIAGQQLEGSDLWSIGGAQRIDAVYTPTVTTMTYVGGISGAGGGTSNLQSSANKAAFIRVELE